jgi:Flp pilus assembly protein TadG
MRVLQLRNAARSDDGAVAVFVAILALLLIGLSAFAVDLGSAYAVKRQLSVAADAAALDAGAAVNAALPAGAGCTPSVLTQIGAQSKAEAAANTTNAGNDNSGKSVIDSVTVRCQGGVVEVDVVNSRTIPSIFGGIFGVDRQVPRRAATSQVFVPSVGVGLRPFAACQDDLSGSNGVITRLNANVGAVPAYGDYFVVWISRTQKVCNSNASGQWGFTNFLDQGQFGEFNDSGTIAYNPGATCAGGNANSGGNAGCQAVWVEDGYNGGVAIPNPASGGNTGLDANSGLANSSDYRDALDALVGQVIQIPVATDYVGSRFNVTGIVSVKVCAVKQSPGSIETGDCYAPDGTSNPLTGNDLNPWTGFKNNEGALQVQFVGFSTSSYAPPNPNADCLADPTCDFGSRAVVLYR